MDKELRHLRKVMGTLPTESLDHDTSWWVGVDGIQVEMYEHPENPYRAIVEGVLSTWGDEDYATKWPQMEPEERFRVVQAILGGQTLPAPLEQIEFGFIVRGVSRASFDQHARMRIGAGFASQGVRDNSRADAGFRVETKIFEDEELREEIIRVMTLVKEVYIEGIKRGHSWQGMRCVLPMGLTHQYKWWSNFLALRGYCSQRLKACEQPDTVQAAILHRDCVGQVFPLLASYLRPGCDYAKRCQYRKAYTLSELFGCLFKPCGRWPDEHPDRDSSSFSWSCSDYGKMGEESGVKLPTPEEWVTFDTFNTLDPRDKALFMEGYEGGKEYERKIESPVSSRKSER